MKKSLIHPPSSGYGVKELNDIQLAWIAGFADGDGSIIATIVPHSDYVVIKYQLRITLSFTQKGKRKFYLILLRNLLGKKGSIRNRKDEIYEYALVGLDAIWLLKLIKPFLFMKKKQANLAIQIFEQLPTAKKNASQFLELCSLADRIANYNDSKRRAVTSETVREDFLGLGLINK